MDDFAAKLAQIIAQNKPQFTPVHNQPPHIPTTKTTEDTGASVMGHSLGEAGGKWLGMEAMDRWGSPARNHRYDVLHTTASMLDESTWEASRHNPNTQALLKDMHDRGDSRVAMENDGSYTFAYYIPKSEAVIRASELGKIMQENPYAVEENRVGQSTPANVERAAAAGQELPQFDRSQLPPRVQGIDPRRAMVAGLSPTGEQMEAGLYGEGPRQQRIASRREEQKENIAFTEARTRATEQDILKGEQETKLLRQQVEDYPEDRQLKIKETNTRIKHMNNQDAIAWAKLDQDKKLLDAQNKDIRLKETYGRVDGILKTREKQESDLQKDYTKTADPVAYAERSTAQTRALLNEIDSVASTLGSTTTKDAQGNVVTTPVNDPFIQKAGTYWAVRGIDVIADAVIRKQTSPEKKKQLFLEAKKFAQYAQKNGVQDPILEKKVWQMYFTAYPEEAKNPANKELLKNFTPEELAQGVHTPWYKSFFSGSTNTGGAYELPTQ